MAALCYRCEHRALFLETGNRPRHECGNANESKFSCYMYKPTKPMVMEPADGTDWRPIFGPPIFAGRAKAVRVADGNYHLKETKDGKYVAWFWPSSKAEK